MFERYEFKERINSQNFEITDWEDEQVENIAGIENFREWVIYESKGVVHNYHDQSLGRLKITLGIIDNDTALNDISLKIELDNRVLFDVTCFMDMSMETNFNFDIKVLKPQYIELFSKVLDEVCDWDTDFENFYRLTGSIQENIRLIQTIYIDRKSSVDIEKLIEDFYNGNL